MPSQVQSELVANQNQALERLSMLIQKLKPLDRQGIAAVLQQHPHVIVIEEHVPQGGLAPQTKQVAWDVQAGCRLDTFTLQDQFIHNNGRHADMADL